MQQHSSEDHTDILGKKGAEGGTLLLPAWSPGTESLMTTATAPTVISNYLWG